MEVVEVDMKPDRQLINPNFDGYKLSLDPLPQYRVPLETDLDIVKLRDDQFSYQHAKALGVHNHLFPDPWNPGSLFFVDDRWKVMKYVPGESTTMLPPISSYQIPDAQELHLQPDRLNVTLHCTDDKRVLIGDGAGHLYLMYTGDRSHDLNWQVGYKGTPVVSHESSSDDPIPQPFIVLHSMLHQAPDGLRVQCLLLHVEKNPESNNENKAPQFLTWINWLTFFSEAGEKWSLERTRRLSGASSPDYASMETDGEAVFIASEKPFSFRYDSLKPVEVKAAANASDTAESDSPAYVWMQTAEDVTVFFSLPAEVTKPDITYKLSSDAVELGIKNSMTLLKGSLFAGVDVEASTWTLSQDDNQNKLELHLDKVNPDSTWPQVIVGDKRGHLVADMEQIENIHERLAHLTSDQMNPDPGTDRAYNTQELEECDACPENTASLARYDGETHSITHQANLGGHQWLFNVQSEAAKPPAFCLRHDVDGLVWQPVSPPSSTSLWQHINTFNALGYVQASKQQKKYSTCSPDFSYAVICDCIRHIYIYRQPSAITSPIRNRKTGREVAAVAKQQLVSLDSVENIHGVYAASDRLYLVVGKALFMVQINVDE